MTILNSPQRCTAPTLYNDFRIARPQRPIVAFTGESLPPPPQTSRMEYADTGDMQFTDDSGFMEYTVDRVV